MLMCAIGLLFGTILSVRHQELIDVDAPEAVSTSGCFFLLSARSHRSLQATYLCEQQTSSGFQRLATIYTIPKAFFIWALVLFVVQMSCVVLSPLPQPLGLLGGTVFIGVALAVFKALNPGYCYSSFFRIPFLCRAQAKKDYTPV